MRFLAYKFLVVQFSGCMFPYNKMPYIITHRGDLQKKCYFTYKIDVGWCFWLELGGPNHYCLVYISTCTRTTISWCLQTVFNMKLQRLSLFHIWEESGFNPALQNLHTGCKHREKVCSNFLPKYKALKLSTIANMIKWFSFLHMP